MDNIPLQEMDKVRMQKMTTKEFKKKAREVHGNRYDYTQSEYTGANNKIVVSCKRHGAFQQRAADHMRGKGCPRCVGKGTQRQEDWVKYCTEIHGGFYDYSKVVFNGSRSKVNVICPKHGEFEQIANVHKMGHGCPKCGRERTTSERKDNKDSFIKKAKRIHGKKYNYNKVVYQYSNVKVILSCKKHGDFYIRPNCHLNGRGCPKCGIESRNKKATKSTNEFIDKANEKHNGKYKYNETKYNKSKSKVAITCLKHGVFFQRPNDHLNGYGCPKCFRYNSKQEQIIKSFMSKFTQIEENNRKILKGKELDIVLPEHQLAIEYNGCLWHSEQYGKHKSYHLDKTQAAATAGYRLIHIFEDEWLDKPEIVKSVLLNAMGHTARRIGARQCELVTLSAPKAREFFERCHLQGFRGGVHKLGLLYQGELVSAMVISRNEIIRFANALNTTVPGGAARLFRHYLQQLHTGGDVISFCDKRWFDGALYKQLGFSAVYDTEPNYYYVKPGDHTRYSRVQFQKHKLRARLDSYDAALSEVDNMINNGYVRVFDCGNTKYVYSQ